MSAEELTARPPNYAELRSQMATADSGVLRVGGFAMLLSGMLVLAVAVTSTLMGSPPPEDSIAYFQMLAMRPGLSAVNFGLYSLADLLMVAALPALYLAFRRWDRTALLHGLSLVALYLVLALGVTELNSLTLVRLAVSLEAATDSGQRLMLQAGANYALATLPVATFFSYVVSSIGLLIVAVVMLRDGFGRWVSLLGIVAFVEGIVGGFYVIFPPLALLLLPCLVTFGLWLVLTGRRLAGLGVGPAIRPSEAPFPAI